MAIERQLCGIDDIYRDLVEAESTAAPSSKGGLVKARADLLALFAYYDGVRQLEKAAPVAATGKLAEACALVRRGVSAPRAARLCGIELTDEARAALMRAEDIVCAMIEMAQFSRAIFDTSSSAQAALKGWRDEVERLTVPEGRREPTLKDLVLDCPELAELVRERFGDPLPPIPTEVA